MVVGRDDTTGALGTSTSKSANTISRSSRRRRSVPSTSWASSGISTARVMPWIVSSPTAVTATGPPPAAAAPRATGSVRVKVAIGNSPVSRADCTRLSRRDSLVVMAVMSASKVAAVRVVPSIVISPVTSGVRPTAVVEPIVVSSSCDAGTRRSSRSRSPRSRTCRSRRRPPRALDPVCGRRVGRRCPRSSTVFHRCFLDRLDGGPRSTSGGASSLEEPPDAGAGADREDDEGGRYELDVFDMASHGGGQRWAAGRSFPGSLPGDGLPAARLQPHGQVVAEVADLIDVEAPLGEAATRRRRRREPVDVAAGDDRLQRQAAPPGAPGRTTERDRAVLAGPPARCCHDVLGARLAVSPSSWRRGAGRVERGHGLGAGRQGPAPLVGERTVAKSSPTPAKSPASIRSQYRPSRLRIRSPSPSTIRGSFAPRAVRSPRRRPSARPLPLWLERPLGRPLRLGHRGPSCGAARPGRAP